ncbi:MAG: gamma-glutamyl-gamma-aminobutyrate hydrolase family protein [Balneolaceae bacterium]|nr:gamma-glutamyl-gamma-aminobutyrate hydrolase family protein [Balneolaceae bacterium]
MHKSKPIIGVTGPEEGGLQHGFLPSSRFGCRGEAVRITPGKSYDIDKLDGLILGGGADINPEYYGQQRKSSLETEITKESRWRKYLVRAITILLYPLVFGIRKLFSVESRA